jgi:PQQ-like domain
MDRHGRRRGRSQAHRLGSTRPIGQRIGVLGIGIGLSVVVLVAATVAAGGSESHGLPDTASASDVAIGDSAAPTAATSTPTSASPSDPVGEASPLPSAGPSATPTGVFPGALLIADRGNGRLLAVDAEGRVVWRFPTRGGLPRGQQFSADDAFLAPDGRSIVANDEVHQVIDRIDIATGKVTWQYGRYGRAGPGLGFLHTPDDAYPLANGNVTVADIRNCRILEVNPAKQVVRTWGRSGRCVHRPPASFAEPNGDTPLPDGGLLITEITGSRIVRLDRTGHVIFDIHAPVRYPSDAQLDSAGNVIVADYSNPGAILRLSPSGRTLWRYGPRTGPGRLDHPSLAVPMPNGLIALNDDGRHRVIILDPRTNRIVWQYGRTDHASAKLGWLNDPDGIDFVRPGIFTPS